MMSMPVLVICAVIMGIPLGAVGQNEVANYRPRAGQRTYQENFKDMVFAQCVAQAYRTEDGPASDAGSSANALREWTYYDLELSPDQIGALIEDYLKRDYSNPLAEAEIKGVKFDFLKCLDLHHSTELEQLTKRMVVDQGRTD